MNSVSLWAAAFAAAALPLLVLVLRLFELRRDLVFLLLYAQVVIYMHVGPAFASAGLASDVLARYIRIEWWTFALFDVPLVVAYLCLSRRWARRGGAPVMALHPGRTLLFSAGSLLLAVGYLVSAARNGLLYRRIGHVNLAESQLQMSLIDFAFYRTFLEFGLFLILFALVLLRRAPHAAARTRRLLGATVVVATAFYLSYALLNSRLSVIIVVSSLFTVFLSTARQRVVVTPRAIVAAAAVAVVGLYMVRVVVNVRASLGDGGPMISLEAFSPLGPRRVTVSNESTAMRLNGVDLIAMIQPGMESFGAARGAAWVIPFVLSLDPIIRTDQTLTLKRLAMTNAKSYLLLRYTGLEMVDYFSCELTDLYGNFGYAGFPAAAVLLAALLALVGTTLSGSGSPTRLVVAVFILSRIVPFEQEFAGLLFTWIKLAPLVVILIWLNPLRTAPGAEPLAEPEPRPRAPVPRLAGA